jgi:hypothetical protein
MVWLIFLMHKCHIVVVEFLVSWHCSWRCLSILDTCSMLCAGGSASLLYRVYWDARYDFHTVGLKVREAIVSYHKGLEIFWWFSVQLLIDIMHYDLTNCTEQVLKPSMWSVLIFTFVPVRSCFILPNNMPLFCQKKKKLICSCWQMEHTASISVTVFTLSSALSSLVIPLIISVKNISLAG